MFFEAIEANMLCKNYWIAVGSDKIGQVGEVLKDTIVTISGWAFTFDEVTGIEVDSDWLNGSGFSQQANGEYQKPGFPFSIVLHEFTIAMFNNQQIAGFRFVHELQHFYAGITQRELIIIPPSNLFILPDLIN